MEAKFCANLCHKRKYGIITWYIDVKILKIRFGSAHKYLCNVVKYCTFVGIYYVIHQLIIFFLVNLYFKSIQLGNQLKGKTYKRYFVFMNNTNF